MRKSKVIYLDYAASVAANPSSIHALGREAQGKLKNARSKVADILRARPEEIIFTSGGTESNNLVIAGAVFAWHEKNPGGVLPHIITTNIEHPSVLETCKMLQKRKLAQVSIVPVEKNGIMDPKKIKKEIKNNTVLVSVMYANNEIGTIQPIKEIAKIIRYYNKKYPHPASPYGRGRSKEGIMLHTDAVQAANYLDLNVEKLGVDMLSLSGSKIEGAGRVGAFYKRKSVPLLPIMGGGDQEMGLRPGTENLSEILKFAEALTLAEKMKEKENKRLTKLRDYFIAKLIKIFGKDVFLEHGYFSAEKFSWQLTSRSQVSKKASFPSLIVNGDLQNRLPNNVNVTFPKIPSDLLVIELSARGIMASSKSACESSRAGGSYVIKAIRDNKGLLAEALAEEGGVRFSLGKSTTKKDIDYTVEALSEILTKLKKWYN